MRYQFGISRPEWFVVPVRLCTWAESSVRCSPGGTAEPMSYSFSRPCAGMKKRHLRIFPYQGTPGAPSFALFAKGGIPRISIPTVAYPTLCKERKGWGTRPFVMLPTGPNTNRSLIENHLLPANSIESSIRIHQTLLYQDVQAESGITCRLLKST